MIELTLDPDGRTFTFRHGATPPLVYLDTWAIRSIAKTERDRFVDALLRRRGTLALSWAGFTELAPLSAEKAEPVSALLRGVLPGNVIFMQVEPGAVIEKENAFQAEPGQNGSPMLDQEWLEVFFGIARKQSLEPFDPVEFMRVLRSPELRKSFRELMRNARGEVSSIFRAARSKVGANEALKKRLRTPLPKGQATFPPTRYIFAEALRHLVNGNQNLEKENHLVDFWHTVVPISYCNYVVLDKNWAAIANQVQKKVWKGGYLPPELEANVFDSVEAFLWHFERESTY